MKLGGAHAPGAPPVPTPMLNGYLTLSAQSSLPHAGDKGIQMLWYEAKIEEGVLVA